MRDCTYLYLCICDTKWVYACVKNGWKCACLKMTENHRLLTVIEELTWDMYLKWFVKLYKYIVQTVLTLTLLFSLCFWKIIFFLVKSTQTENFDFSSDFVNSCVESFYFYEIKPIFSFSASSNYSIYIFFIFSSKYFQPLFFLPKR